MFRTATNANDFGDLNYTESMPNGPTADLDLLIDEGMPGAAWQQREPRMDPDLRAPDSNMTIRDFVEQVFVPEHVSLKKRSGRTHYQAILKHVLTPEQVDGVFRSDPDARNRKLKAVPNWPYLGNMQIGETRPEDVQRLISAAVAGGYATQTVLHIRSVVRTIFAHARQKRCFTGDNPADPVRLPELVHKDAHILTFAQAKRVLSVMQYPEKELALIAILTGMTAAEICGLQWKDVNLTEVWSGSDDDPISPMTITIRRQWCRGELHELNGECRNLPIPDLLFPLLFELRRRTRHKGPDHFVLTTRAGMPVDWKGSAARRLKPIGRVLQMPWLSWGVFRRTRTSWLNEVGMQFHELVIGQQSDPAFPVRKPVSRKPLSCGQFE